ncbi:MAG: primary-amine oxidase [Streptomyces sp.]|nr:primary-amine oxidase [Streptomyces sp.]
MFTTSAAIPMDRAHPLARLTEEEILGAREIVRSAGLDADAIRYVYVGLEEPSKQDVLAFDSTAQQVDRRARIMLVDTTTGVGTDIVVSLNDERVVRADLVDPMTAGQVPLLNSEVGTAEEIVSQSAEWAAALARRGLRVDQVRAVPLSAGYFGDESEIGHRLSRVGGFAQFDKDDLPWAHPVDGLVAYVDLAKREIRRIVDDRVAPVPRERGQWDAPPHSSSQRTTLRPIEITQPEGPSFSIEDDVLIWENWKLRLGFDAREGLTLHQISFNDAGRERPIIYRASLAEMIVVYADPSPARFYLNYFDAGEYMFFRNTNSLQLGCDCLGEIRYLDVTIADEFGKPQRIPNAVCIHEEDYGLLWKHNDIFNGMSESRRSRRLVISSFTTIGNYDYGFYWYLYLDGRIELEAKATGVVFTSQVPHGGSPYATEIAPELGAPFHQHMFCARLDMMIDGSANFVEEHEAKRLPMSATNPYGNAFTRSVVRLRTEKEGAREANAATGRVWRVASSDARNRLDQPTAYELHSNNYPLLLADESSSTVSRATFATKHLWVTKYSPDERYPAGDFVNQSLGGGGLPDWIEADESIEDENIVLWHTFGLTHFPRPEDWPVMPMDYAGFTLKPFGFFDRNPVLDVPPSPAGHCSTSAPIHAEGGGCY